MVFAGVDPGKYGAISFLDGKGKCLEIIDYRDELDMANKISVVPWKPSIVMLEFVHPFPGEGVKSVHSLSQNLGIWKGILAMLKWPVEEVSPMKWRNAVLDSPSKKGKKTAQEKKEAKEKIVFFARRKWPEADIEISEKRDSEMNKRASGKADSLCIAEYGRMKWMNVKKDLNKWKSNGELHILTELKIRKK